MNPKIEPKAMRFNLNLIALGLWVVLGVSCTTLPTPKLTRYSFPKKVAFVGDVNRPYKTLGLVRTKVNFTSLDSNHEESLLCTNYYNKAVGDLYARARKVGADAIIDVKSVVFLEDGKQEFYKTAECADDGQEGQILLQAIAVQWTGPAPSPSLLPILLAPENE